MNKKTKGYLMAVIGFIFILFSTFSYIMDWESRNSASATLGLVFVVIGMKQARNFSEQYSYYTKVVDMFSRTLKPLICYRTPRKD